MAEQKNGFKKEIKLGKTKYPEKTYINLAVIGQQKIDWRKAVPAILLIILAACAFSKFAISDRLTKLNELRSENAAISRRISEYDRVIAEYEGLNDEYAHYTYAGWTDEESNRVSRVDVIELMDTYIGGRATVDSWSVDGNVLKLTTHDIDLAEANEIAMNLEADELVSFCSLTTANIKNAETGDSLRVSMTVYLNGPVDLSKN